MGRIPQKAGILLAAAVLGLTAMPGMASAYNQRQFMAGWGLSHGNAYSDPNAVPYLFEVRTYSDHTVCPAVASGYGGYTSTPFSGGHNTAYYASDCGYNGQFSDFNPVSSYLHGAAYNPNSATDDYINYAYVFWS